MHQTDKYAGIPYKKDGRSYDGADCWGIICLVFMGELSIKLPSFIGARGSLGREKRQKIDGQIKVESKKWNEIEIPQPFDVALFEDCGVNGHVGLVVNSSQMLHTTKGSYSRVERFDGFMHEQKLIGFYRYAR